MQRALFFKIMTIGVITLILLIPLSNIESTIHERERYQEQATKNIARSWTGKQTIYGVLLVAPYKEKRYKTVETSEHGVQRVIQKEYTVQRHKYFLPDELNISANLLTQERYRGIYSVPVYESAVSLKGQLTLPKHLGIDDPAHDIIWETPYLAIGVQDIRGISRLVNVAINTKDLQVHPGPNTPIFSNGLHSFIKHTPTKDQNIDFDISFNVKGMQEISFIPTGKFTTVSLKSTWPHPSFIGHFLPKTRDINEQGFSAYWETSFFANTIEQHLRQCASTQICHEFNHNTFGVALHQPVNIYTQAKRSLKYALLFIGLTFVVFFLFEILKGLAIHPIQYGLVGISLALFYLLLISLSEHISFGLSYLIATIACVGMLSFYVSFVLRSKTRAIIFGLSLTGLYGALHMLIRSQDYALLMGTILLFCILTFIMAITRHIDWYTIEGQARDLRASKKKFDIFTPSQEADSSPDHT